MTGLEKEVKPARRDVVYVLPGVIRVSQDSESGTDEWYVLGNT